MPQMWKTRALPESVQKVEAVHQDELNSGETDDPFLGVVGEVEKPWVVDVLLNETPMEFHINT